MPFARPLRLSLLAAAGTALLSFPAAAPAQAGYHHYGWGWGGAALVGGLALGALAASAATAAPVYVEPSCYEVRRRVRTPYGWRVVRETVCE